MGAIALVEAFQGQKINKSRSPASAYLDLQSVIDNRSSDYVELDSQIIYEAGAPVVVPTGVTLASLDGSKVQVRKTGSKITGIRSHAQMIAAYVQSNPGNILFDANGDVIGYNGVQSAAALNQAMAQLDQIYRSQGFLDKFKFQVGIKHYMFEVPAYTRKCFNSAGESLLCNLTTVSATTVKFRPFYKVINDSPFPDYDELHKEGALPVLSLGGDNVVIRDLDVGCHPDLPYYPVYYLGESGSALAYPQTGAVPGFTSSGMYIDGVQNIEVENSVVRDCALGIYALNNNDVRLLNNEILTNVKSASIEPFSAKETSYFAVKPAHRFHGINGIRIHGTLDKNYLVKGNVFGGSSEGAQKALHIHGTSPAGRDRTLPSGQYASEDEGLAEIARYIDRSDSQKVLGRKNFKILQNTVASAHLAGIDLEGDLLNVEIRDNAIENVSLRYYQPQSINDRMGYAIKLSADGPGPNLFKRFLNTSTNQVQYYSVDFSAYPKNVLIKGNTLRNSTKGIGVLYSQDGNTLGYDDFPINPLAGLSQSQTCDASPYHCSSKISIEQNLVENASRHCLYMISLIGAEVKNNTFDTCNIRAENSGKLDSSAVYLYGVKHVDLRGNSLYVNEDPNGALAQGRQALPITSDDYIAVRVNGGGHLVSFNYAEWAVQGITQSAFLSSFNYANYYPRYGYPVTVDNALAPDPHYVFDPNSEVSYLGE